MSLASLFDLAGPDLIIILLIVLLLFGARKLPDLSRGIWEAIRQFIKARDEFEREAARPPETEWAADRARPWKNFLARLHRGYAGAVAAPFPLSG